MHLKTIKLAGFKSFVDPTVIPFRSHCVGVVGPNGCGKSNIIDAVRWVMGELSAKQLRGDSMTDVIFNGATTRKPASQASIELVFDNSDAKLGGAYAKYAEISLCRKVTSDGNSDYFLNGAACRRKDIRDTFLGTGLNPRSYSIIEQGMITKLIEAKPDELREHVEEAAGISKYKERRHETENRIRHTRDNISRLNDIREELGKNLDRLKRQSRAAERFKVLKEQLRLTRAQLHVLHWLSISKAIRQQEGRIKEAEIALEAKLAERQGIETNIEKARLAQTEQSEAFNSVQGRYYGIGSEITRIEQTIQHNKSRCTELEQDLAELEQTWQETQSLQDTDQQRQNTLRAELTQLKPQGAALNKECAEKQQILNLAEQAMTNWQTRWDSFNTKSAQATQQYQVEGTRIKHLEEKISNLRQRIEKNEKENVDIDFGDLPERVKSLITEQAEIQQSTAALQEETASVQTQIRSKREERQQLQEALDSVKGKLQSSLGRRVSLEGLQQAALGQDREEAMEWLFLHGLADQSRLAQTLTVDEGWETAVETVLGSYLEAVCVEDVVTLTDALEGVKDTNLLFLGQTRTETTPGASGIAASPILEKVKSPYALSNPLSGIYFTETLAEAMDLRSQLQAHESIVTRDGLWLGPQWLRVYKRQENESGILERERELKKINASIVAEERQVKELAQELETVRARLTDLEQKRETTQTALQSKTAQQGELQAELRTKEIRLEHLRQRETALAHELTDCRQQLSQAEEQLIASRLVWERSEEEIGHSATERDQLTQERDECRRRLDKAREAATAARQEANTINMRAESLHTQLEMIQQNIDRTVKQITQLLERKEHITQSIHEAASPLTTLGHDLEAKLAERLDVEAELNALRQRLEAAEEQLQTYEKERSSLEETLQAQRSALEQLRMTWQGDKVRATTHQEEISNSGFQLDTLLQELPEGASVNDWEASLEKIHNRINRLGPINLAAIDEFQQESERKTYLDAQHDDLIEALTVLENAIRKIDRETRARFKETFEAINEGFQKLFPKIFGGGKAYLSLTSDDLLTTGVEIFAHPPGKRNATIHLLSGGEKALTAIALVFSIFQLNPAPFCLLDEVDAPLDDANVGRFGALVKEMSNHVQFIVITHNKGTMAIADQLLGITMQEPGVSRLVSVDIEEAMAMAEA